MDDNNLIIIILYANLLNINVDNNNDAIMLCVLCWFPSLHFKCSRCE